METVIAVDAMGSDRAPKPEIEGALLAVRHYPGVRVLLVGPEERLKRTERCRRVLGQSGLPASEVERRLASLPALSWNQAQRDWDKMFMIDLYPDNRRRFGVDMKAVAEAIAKACNL